MSRPEGSKNRAKWPRWDDAYGNVFLEGPARKQAMKSTSNLLNSSWLLDQATLQDIYLANGWGRRIVDCVADEMTRAGFKVDGLDNEDLEDKIQSRIEDLQILDKFNLAVKWARAFGGSGIVLGVKDGGTLETPLDPEKISKLEFLRVYDRWEMSEAGRYSDPNDEKFGRVEFWQITPTNIPNATAYKVHESRILIFNGDTLPNRLQLANQGFGASVMQKCLVEVMRMNNGHRWAEMLLERSQQAVHKIPGLSDTLATKEGENLVAKRVDIADRVRSAQNMIVIDGEEEYTVQSLAQTGTHEVLDRFAEALSAVTGIPIFVLMGRSRGGLNATDETNEDAWYATVLNMQNGNLKQPLVTIVKMLFSEMGKGGSEGEGDNQTDQWKICFNPLRVRGDVEEADIAFKRGQGKKAQADALQVYVNMGALDPEEVRNQLADDEEFAEYIDATIVPVPPAEKLLGQKLENQPDPAGTGSGTSGGTGGRKPAAKKAAKKPAAKR
jgi:phage-related protein (TIGR01555 family)